MIRRRYPHLRIQDVRGNIGTRLRKLDDPALGFDCVILAGAGIERIGLRERIGEWLGPDPTSTEAEVGRKEGEGEEDSENKKGTRDGQAEAMLHAVGQGAVGLEFREGDNWLLGLLDGKEGTRGVIINRVSWECQAERSLLRTLEGGCSVPVGVSCRWENDESTTSPAAAAVQQPATSTDAGTVAMPTAPEEDPSMQPGTLHMLASVTSVDGTECVAAARRQRVGCDQEADDAGWELARVLVEKGAERILKEITLNRGMVERGDGA